MRPRNPFLRLPWLLPWIVCPVLAHASTGRELVFQPEHSEASFSVRLVWFQTVSGSFSDLRGSVHIDPATGMAQVDAHIRVDSVAVHPAHYRKRLLGSRFFDAQRFPYIHFVSDPLGVDALRNKTSLKGRLTLHGVTRPLSLQLSDSHCRGDGLDGCTLHLHGWLNRTRYDMHAYRALVSKRVRLDLVIQLETFVPGAPAAARSSDNR